LRLTSGGEVMLPEADPAGALATLAALHEERGVLDFDVQFLDFRNDGEMVIRPWPDRAERAAGRGA
ncbi:MAG: cell division protein FtsQ, partial [Oceanicaulis sp.]